MTTAVNKSGTDWLVTKGWLTTKIDELHREMEASRTLEDYNYLRGQIALARALIEHVEPTAPPQTTEDDYGMTPTGIGPY